MASRGWNTVHPVTHKPGRGRHARCHLCCAALHGSPLARAKRHVALSIVIRSWTPVSWIDLSTNGPNWLASGSGTPSPLKGWWAPVAQHHKREWGPQAHTTRFAATTVATTLLTLADWEGVLKRREAPPAPPHSTSTSTVAARVQIFTDEAVKDTTIEVEVRHSQFYPLNLLLVDSAILSMVPEPC
jgi:hypothetical protein